MKTRGAALISALVSFLQFRKLGQVKIDDLIYTLAWIWHKTGYKSLQIYAREIAADAGLMDKYLAKWNSWNESLFSPDAVRGKILFNRKREKELLKWGSLSEERKAQTEQNIKMIEGKLILMDYLEKGQKEQGEQGDQGGQERLGRQGDQGGQANALSD